MYFSISRHKNGKPTKNNTGATNQNQKFVRLRIFKRKSSLKSSFCMPAPNTQHPKNAD